MKFRYSCLLVPVMLILVLSCNGEKEKNGRAIAEKELKAILGDSRPLLNHKPILIKSKDQAINIAEPVLFETYGKDHIIEQQPYEAYLISNYWVISGTLEDNMFALKDGGVFIIMIDASTSEVVYISHGK